MNRTFTFYLFYVGLNPDANRARRCLTSLTWPMPLLLHQTSHSCIIDQSPYLLKYDLRACIAMVILWRTVEIIFENIILIAWGNRIWDLINGIMKDTTDCDNFNSFYICKHLAGPYTLRLQPNQSLTTHYTISFVTAVHIRIAVHHNTSVVYNRVPRKPRVLWAPVTGSAGGQWNYKNNGLNF